MQSSVLKVMRLGPLSQTLKFLPCSQYCSSGTPHTQTLESLYPGSVSSVAKPPPQTDPNIFTGYIPIKELKFTYSGSSGPGGQNVNKVATKVDIRFHLGSATWLTDPVKEKLQEKLGSELTKDGWMVVKSDRTRSQSLNQADALEKLRSNIRTALQPPKPTFTALEEEKMRKGKIKAARERLHTKRERSLIKENRKGPEL